MYIGEIVKIIKDCNYKNFSAQVKNYDMNDVQLYILENGDVFNCDKKDVIYNDD